jgi:hypothetical protein
MRSPPSWPAATTPLSQEQLTTVEGLQRRMVIYYVVAMTVLSLAALLIVKYADIIWLRRTLLALVLGLLAGAAVIQLRSRCPRCNGRLGLTGRLRMPERCPTCRVALARAPVETAADDGA